MNVFPVVPINRIDDKMVENRRVREGSYGEALDPIGGYGNRLCAY